MKALVKLSVVIGLFCAFSSVYAESGANCDSLEGRQRMMCELKGFKKNPPNIMDDACGLWMRLAYEIDPALADLEKRGGVSEEETGLSIPEMLRLRHEAGDQFGAYAIGILQMPRELRRYKTCDSSKATFLWADAYEVAERIARSKARVSKDIFKSVLMADIGRHLDELRKAMHEGYLPSDEALSCIASVVDGAKVYDIALSTEQWGTEENAAVEKVRKNTERICYTEVSIHLRPR